MKLKLREDPGEWLKFIAVIGCMAAVGGWLAHRRGWVPFDVGWVWAPFIVATGWCWIRPRHFRGFYRVGMTFFFRVGQVMSFVLLSIFFFVMMTPLGLALRLLGKDLLKLKRDPTVKSYWEKPRRGGDMDRQF